MVERLGDQLFWRTIKRAGQSAGGPEGICFKVFGGLSQDLSGSAPGDYHGSLWDFSPPLVTGQQYLAEKLRPRTASGAGELGWCLGHPRAERMRDGGLDLIKDLGL